MFGNVGQGPILALALVAKHLTDGFANVVGPRPGELDDLGLFALHGKTLPVLTRSGLGWEGRRCLSAQHS